MRICPSWRKDKYSSEEEREGLFRIGVAFVLAEKLSLVDPIANRAVTVGKFFNQIINDPNF